MTFADIPEAMQDLSHPHRHGGLARARVAGEAHMERWRPGGQAERRAELVYQQQSRNVANAALYRREPDEFAFQPVQDLADLRVTECGVEVQLLRCHDGVHGAGPSIPLAFR